MNEPNYKLIDGTAYTVSELKELLNKVPDDYLISLSGMNCFAILMDTNNKTMLLDDINFINELLDENEVER